MDLHFILAIVLAYLLGSLPFAVWISKYFFKQDIRTLGSGNAGSTNMYRSFGFWAGFSTQVLDILKSFAATMLPLWLSVSLNDNLWLSQLLFGLASVIGHVYPIFAGFQGGKGVNSILGMMLAIAPIPTLFCLLVFLITLWFSEYVSLGSILATLAFTVLQLWGLVTNSTLYNPLMLLIGIMLSLFIVFTHRQNIIRIKNGTESKASFILKLKKKL